MNFEILKDKKNYIYVGRLEESKGVYALLDVWNTLDDNYILTLIGGGDIEEKLRKKYNNKNIIFKGKCSRTETLTNISESKFLIQPSLLYETFGLTIIEAMNFAVPVIGFDIGTRKNFIKDSENGFLSDGENLKEVIEKSYEYKEYEKLSQNALNTAKLYENKYITTMQIDIYKKILYSDLSRYS